MNAAGARAGPHHPRAGLGSSRAWRSCQHRSSLLFLTVAISLHQASAAFPTAAEGTSGVSITVFFTY